MEEEKKENKLETTPSPESGEVSSSLPEAESEEETSTRGEMPFPEREEKKTLSKAERGYFGRMHGLCENNASFRALCGFLRSAGKTYLSQKLREEEKAYDDLFIEKLEEGFDAIDSILLNPRTFIKESPELVDAGRAKKINAQSIVHLSSHTQYVYEVKDNNDVTPMKILTINSDVDYQIYENRFVWSLIQKAALFIEKRFHYIQDHGETRDSELLLLHNETEISGTRYEMDSRIAISRPSRDGGKAEHNADLLLRLAKLRERAAFYRKSAFAERMKGAKPVANPIHLTNLIVKEPHYHACYELWTFLDSYTQLGVHFDVKETEHPFTEADFEDLTALIASSYLNVRSSLGESELPQKTKAKALDPKVVFSLEDETYNDGRFLYDQFKDGLPPLKEGQEDRTTPENYPDFESAKKQREELQERFASYSVKKHLVDMAIEEDKARQVALEAEARRKAVEEEARRKQREAREAYDREQARKAAINRAYAAIDENQRMLEEERMRLARAEARKQALRAKGLSVDPLASPLPPAPEPLPVIPPALVEEEKKKKYKTVTLYRDAGSGATMSEKQKKEAENSGKKFVRVSKEEIRRRREEAEKAKAQERAEAPSEESPSPVPSNRQSPTASAPVESPNPLPSSEGKNNEAASEPGEKKESRAIPSLEQPSQPVEASKSEPTENSSAPKEGE